MSVNNEIDGEAICDGIDQLTGGVPELIDPQKQPLNVPNTDSSGDLAGGAVDAIGSELIEGAMEIAGDVVGAVIGAAGELIAGIFD